MAISAPPIAVKTELQNDRKIDVLDQYGLYTMSDSEEEVRDLKKSRLNEKLNTARATSPSQEKILEKFQLITKDQNDTVITKTFQNVLMTIILIMTETIITVKTTER